MGLGDNDYRLPALIICIIHVLFVNSVMETICLEKKDVSPSWTLKKACYRCINRMDRV